MRDRYFVITAIDPGSAWYSEMLQGDNLAGKIISTKHLKRSYTHSDAYSGEWVDVLIPELIKHEFYLGAFYGWDITDEVEAYKAAGLKLEGYPDV